ncbi:hypothetical protein Fcan01_23645 [Folsomia candida]|uniref:BED-type domain-containing protein n=1 Tax=Folsomia candida TaxID=158441 RepID=A0A226D8X4_FOLCA|nr:hypothetical protein Fcan01_23645 [Folsomia candida]
MEEQSPSQSQQTSPSDETAETRSLWDLFSKIKGTQDAKCLTCDQVLKNTRGRTSGLHVHLRTRHKIFIKKRTELGDKSTENGDLIPRSKQQKISELIPTLEDKSLEAVLSRLISLDGLPFAVFSTSVDLRDLFTSSGYIDVPKTPQIIRNNVIQHAQKIRGHVTSEIGKFKNLGKKFSVTFDEWTSKRNRSKQNLNCKYINVNVHRDDIFWSLGLVRIHGGAPAEKCLELVAD